MPFGEDPNDLPISLLQDEFNASLRALMHPKTLTPPVFKYSRRIHCKLRRQPPRMQSFEKTLTEASSNWEAVELEGQGSSDLEQEYVITGTIDTKASNSTASAAYSMVASDATLARPSSPLRQPPSGENGLRHKASEQLLQEPSTTSSVEPQAAPPPAYASRQESSCVVERSWSKDGSACSSARYTSQKQIDQSLPSPGSWHGAAGLADDCAAHWSAAFPGRLSLESHVELDEGCGRTDHSARTELNHCLPKGVGGTLQSRDSRSSSTHADVALLPAPHTHMQDPKKGCNGHMEGIDGRNDQDDVPTDTTSAQREVTTRRQPRRQVSC
eukprot:TRINITY_DN33712_c0_g1_i3.p1 TRINITY_DN33712_c0_g1~~TRINITY_DN33712_c0_g1_i3.p1  ORF type:complete len:328 (-),score=24.17 TRINITY_DN33712_c0_g1_i3:72-1055(-)